MDKELKEFEVYKILNERVVSEFEEFNGLNKIFLLVNSGLFVIMCNVIMTNKEAMFSAWLTISIVVVLCAAGLFSSFIWRSIDEKATEWKNYWFKQLKRQEEIVDIELDIWDKDKSDELDELGGVWDLVSKLPYIFIAIWSLVLLCGLILLLWKIFGFFNII